MTRAGTAALALTLALVLALPLAGAQGPLTTSVTIALSKGDVTLGAANETDLEATIRNTGAVDGTASLRITDLGSWTATASPSTSVAIPAGGSAAVKIHLIAPRAGDGASTRNIAFIATITDAAGRTASADAKLSATFISPSAPPPPPFYETPAFLAGVALLLVASLATATVLARRRAKRAAAERAAYVARETGIRIAIADGPHPFGASRDVTYRARVWNDSDRPRVAVLGPVDAPAGWRVTPSLPRMPLSPGESVNVTYLVSPSPDARSGEGVELTLRAKPEEAQELWESVVLRMPTPDVRVPKVGESIKSSLKLRVPK